MPTDPPSSLRNGRVAGEGAFSLLQLMVVMILIAVLSTLLFSVMRDGLESSRQAKCASQLRQIHLAMMNYGAEHRGRLSPYLVIQTGRAHQYWVALLRPYLSLPATRLWADNTPTGVYACPSDRRPKGDYSADPAENGAYGLCGLNGLAWGMWAYPDGRKLNTWSEGVSLLSVKNPGKTVMLVEHEQVFAATPQHLRTSRFAFRHKGKINVIYFDGHIGAISKGEVPDANTSFWDASSPDL